MSTYPKAKTKYPKCAFVKHKKRDTVRHLGHQTLTDAIQ